MGKVKRKIRKKVIQTCCGGIHLRNGRCPICGEKYDETPINVNYLTIQKKEKLIELRNG